MHEDPTEAYIHAWHGISPPNPQSRRLAAELPAVIRNLEAQRPHPAFEAEPAAFELALQPAPPRWRSSGSPTPEPPAAPQTRPNHLSLTQAAAAIANRDLTAEALLEACLAEIDAHDHAINATIWIDRDAARRSARDADKALAAGAAPGPLHGIPLAHKDMYYQQGRTSTCGSLIRKTWTAPRTASVLDRLHQAGSITFAGLNMAEFAQNPTGHNRHFGDCRNPWNLPRITGGSSSGSGAAVAARFTPAALGSDTGGSIRLPASACGTVGLKPTQTRVSRAGVMPLSFSADNVGPLARTARDCARILSIIAGPDPADPTASRAPVPDYEAALDGDLRGLVVGRVENPALLGTDPHVTAALDHALAVLKARGATIRPITLPLLDAIAAYVAILSRSEAAAIHARWMRERPQDYAPHLSARLYPGYAIPAALYIEALAARGPILQRFCAETFAEVDVLALPTIATQLPTLAETDIDQGPPGTEHRFMAVSANTRPFNYLGLPALSLMCGLDSNACPIGLQLVAPPFAEPLLLQTADAYQHDTDWHTRLPPPPPSPPANSPKEPPR